MMVAAFLVWEGVEEGSFAHLLLSSPAALQLQHLLEDEEHADEEFIALFLDLLSLYATLLYSTS